MFKQKQEKLFTMRMSLHDWDLLKTMAQKMGIKALSDVIRVSIYEKHEKLSYEVKNNEIR